MSTFSERTQEWSRHNLLSIVSYIYGIQFAFLMNLYGRRFLANKITNGFVSNTQYSYPSLTRSYEITPPLPPLNTTYYRNSDDFGFALGVGIFLGVSTFVVFSVQVVFFRCWRFRTFLRKKPTRQEMSIAWWELVHRIADLFYNSFFYMLCFSWGFFLYQSCVQNLAKAMFYPNETEVPQWQVKFNVDYVGWHFLSQFIISAISFTILTIMYAMLHTVSDASSTRTERAGRPLCSRYRDHMIASMQRFLEYIVGIVTGMWIAFSFIPLFADGMFGYVYQYSDYQPRLRFQQQVAYEMTSAFVLVSMVSVVYFMLVNVNTVCAWLCSCKTYEHLKQDEDDLVHQLYERGFVAPFISLFKMTFPLVQALMWGILFCYGFLLYWSDATTTSYYPSIYVGPLFLATLMTSLFLYALEFFLYDGETSNMSREYCIQQSTILPLVFIIAYPVAYANSEDFTLYTGKYLFGGFSDYPTAANLYSSGWWQMLLLFASGVVSFVLFPLVTYRIDTYLKRYKA